jgi:hypothetical protein
VSLSQIRYFVAVAEEKNVGRAAQRLRVAQPPISRHIRSLEEELGATLFTRTPRGMELLPAGEVFLDRARKILEAVDEAAIATRTAARPADDGVLATASARGRAAPTGGGATLDGCAQQSGRRPAHERERFVPRQAGDIGEPHQSLDARRRTDGEHEASNLGLGERPVKRGERVLEPADGAALPEEERPR